MAASGIPLFGTIILCAVMIVAAYTAAVAFVAGGSASGERVLKIGRPGLLASARAGTFVVCALVLVAIALLAFAFQTHDFRIEYVAHYSDRTMPWWYLVTSLWGGQDGSLLWWTFLLAGYTTAALIWMRDRWLELQPWVIFTLMLLFIFFSILMLFAANPFATTFGPPIADGDGLNPLLQNYWMVIHPPALYMGFVGWAIPFSFCIAGLATGRLHAEWVKAARLFAMITWTFLSVGLLLGMLWSYEELGWGGYLGLGSRLKMQAFFPGSSRPHTCTRPFYKNALK